MIANNEGVLKILSLKLKGLWYPFSELDQLKVYHIWSFFQLTGLPTTSGGIAAKEAPKQAVATADADADLQARLDTFYFVLYTLDAFNSAGSRSIQGTRQKYSRVLQHPTRVMRL